MTTDPTPSRSLVTMRAVRDLVRTAVLSSYGVTGIATGGCAAFPLPGASTPSATTAG